MTGVVIDPAHRGPARSGNGGWTAGTLAALLPDLACLEVTLRRPPPLGTPLEVRHRGSGADLLDDGDVVATAEPAEAPEPVAPVDADTARAAERRYPGLSAHPFPGCFVCGTEQAEGAGLRLRPGPVAPGRTACTWTPHPAHTETPHLWAALDCPGGWTATSQTRPLVLGRITAVVRRRPRAGERLIVVGALLDTAGRKSHTATTVYDAAGRQVGCAVHTWIQVDPQSFA